VPPVLGEADGLLPTAACAWRLQASKSACVASAANAPCPIAMTPAAVSMAVT
jgi:hypothetical protein